MYFQCAKIRDVNEMKTMPPSGRCAFSQIYQLLKNIHCFQVRSLSCWCSAALCVEDKVGEVVLFGPDGEVVVTNAVPLVVKKANEGNHEAERQTDP